MKSIKKLISISMVGILAMSFSACNMIAKTPEAIAKSVVVKVNGEKITRGELDKNPQVEQVITQIKTQYGENYETNADAKAALKEQKAQILDSLVTEKILLQKAKELKVIPEDKVLNDEITKKFTEIKTVYSNDDAKFAEALKQAGFTETSLKDYLKTQIIVDKVVENITKDVKIDDAKAKEYYNTNQIKYTEKPNTMNISHILVKTQDEANKVKERLDKGEKFADVAKQVSTDPGSKDKGGDLGTVNYVDSGLDQQFMTAAMALKEGQISAPIQTQFGFHIILVTKKQEFPVKAFDTVKEDIKKSLLDAEKQKIFTTKTDEWKKAAKITKYDNNLV